MFLSTAWGQCNTYQPAMMLCNCGEKSLCSERGGDAADPRGPSRGRKHAKLLLNDQADTGWHKVRFK